MDDIKTFLSSFPFPLNYSFLKPLVLCACIKKHFEGTIRRLGHRKPIESGIKMCCRGESLQSCAPQAVHTTKHWKISQKQAWRMHESELLLEFAPSVSSITAENWSSVLRSFIELWKICRVRCKLYVFNSSLAGATIGRVYDKLTRDAKKNGSRAKYSETWHVKVKPEMKRRVPS